MNEEGNNSLPQTSAEGVESGGNQGQNNEVVDSPPSDLKPVSDSM